ncbi:MAG: hypothetical protein H6654_16860 [Ardenticatenaceae bacterium]|nr:hypothetical protein [Ardenticatenaceae bacterium]MCB8975233.1 hypothetical protein [Ardenticatenaceae bacterium]
MAAPTTQTTATHAAGGGNGRFLLHHHDQKIEADERQPSIEPAQALAEIFQIPTGQHDVFVEIARGERPSQLQGTLSRIYWADS